MGGGSNPYLGQNLQNQSAGSYTQALGEADNATTTGQNILGQGGEFGSDAASGFKELGGFNPNLTAGQLATTDLKPYMNPFTRDVTDVTMNELNRQEALQARGLEGQAQDQGAFGGDRFAIQEAANNRNFDTTRAQTVAGLNQANFNQAQGAAGQDIAGRYQADLANANARQRGMETGAGGLATLASQYGNLGAGLMQGGAQDLSRLSQQGFDYGQTLRNNQLQTGNAMQGQVQSLIDKIQAQYGSATGQPQTGLDTILKSLQGTYDPKKTTSSTDPGIGGIVSGVGSLIPGK